MAQRRTFYMVGCFIAYVSFLICFQIIKTRVLSYPIREIDLVAQETSLVTLLENQLKALHNKPIDDHTLENLRQGLSRVIEYAGLEWQRTGLDSGRLTLVPHQWVAQVQTQEGVLWLTEEGKLISKAKLAEKKTLPILVGERSDSKVLWQAYQQFEAIAKSSFYQVKSLAYPETAYFEIRLDNGIAIILEKEKAEAHFARSLALLKSRFHKVVDQIAYMDCRYDKGCALGFKPGFNRSAQ